MKCADGNTAPRNTAPSALHLLKCALGAFTPVKRAFLRIAPSKSQPDRVAPSKTVSAIPALEKSLSMNVQLERFAPSSRLSQKLHDSNSAFSKSVVRRSII